MPEQASDDKPLATFEASMGELEKVVKELESGDLPLDRALALFEKGTALSETCRKQLQILLKKNDKVQAEPFPSNPE
jgi:exodeoxyribonuclease VII small subunit